MTTEPNEQNRRPAHGGDQARPAHPRVDRRIEQRNYADRFFPGPSRPMSDQRSEHIEGLLKPFDANAAAQARLEKRRRATGDGTAELRETLEQQNELLRAILASSVDTQEDARSTAQNSRTFAWAGTAIALLTLVATVISIVAAVTAH